VPTTTGDCPRQGTVPTLPNAPMNPVTSVLQTRVAVTSPGAPSKTTVLATPSAATMSSGRPSAVMADFSGIVQDSPRHDASKPATNSPSVWAVTSWRP